MNGFGEGFGKQRSGHMVVARNINQFRKPVEALIKAGVGAGLIQQDLAGGIPYTRTRQDLVSIARAGPDIITAADWSDPDRVILGTGFVVPYTDVFDETDGTIGLPGGTLEPVLNWYEGTVASNHGPLFVIKINGIWHLNNFQCP